MFNLKPAREAAKKSEIVMDLDDLISSRVGFRFNGEIHYIKPLTTIEFFKASNELSKMVEFARNPGKVSADDLISVYVDLFSSVCDTIGRKEVESMQQSQVAALYQFILDKIRGKPMGEDAEKKNLKTSH